MDRQTSQKNTLVLNKQLTERQTLQKDTLELRQTAQTLQNDTLILHKTGSGQTNLTEK